jgi:hypothetical protein
MRETQDIRARSRLHMHKQNHYQYRIERTEYEARGKGEARAFVSLRSAGRKKMFDRHDMLSHSSGLAVVVAVG